MSLVKVNARSSLEQYAFTLTSVTTGLIAVKTQNSTSGTVPVLFVFLGALKNRVIQPAFQ